jgi:hypothetical protein
MTVIVGDNESGKSSWHAALFVALCGRRRRRGPPTKDDQAFADRRKPWGDEQWRVTAKVVLDDGRPIELHQELSRGVDCWARDEQLGRDVSSEIIHDGAPDGSRWLGLDRASFAATACVAQSQLLRVLDDADGLQEHLQRAAATAGTGDTTLAAALERLEQFTADKVGSTRANSTKPLQATGRDRDMAGHRLEHAQQEHDCYLQSTTEVERLRQQAEHLFALYRAHEAAATADRRDRLADSVREATRLYSIYSDTAPVSPVVRSELAKQVSDALAAWSAAPAPDQDAAAKRAKLAKRIEHLPLPPTGDLQVHPSVAKALEDVRDLGSQLRAHDTTRPPESPETFRDVSISDNELLELARELDQRPGPRIPSPAASPATAAPNSADGRPTAMRASTRRVAAISAFSLGGLLIAAAVVLGGTVHPAPAAPIAAALLGIFLLVAGWLIRRGRAVSGGASDAPQTVLDLVRTHAASAQQRRDDALARCHALELPTDADLLRQVPIRRVETETLKHWSQRRHDLDQSLRTAAHQVSDTLRERGEQTEQSGGDTDDPTSMITRTAEAEAQRYQDRCHVRADEAMLATTRENLTSRVTAIDGDADRDRRARERAGSLLQAAARACAPHHDDTNADILSVVAALRSWQGDHDAELTRFSVEQKDWAHLQALLDGRTLGELVEAANEAQAQAEGCIGKADPALVRDVEACGVPTETRLSELRDRAAQAQSEADTAAGKLSGVVQSLPSVTEAEEALNTAEAAHNEVLRLRATLDLTQQFLRAAQESVHREIADVLADTVRADLSKLTGGRYTEVSIDPVNLQVTVRGPASEHRPRNAAWLSHGTAEQIFLLLRIALAAHLTTERRSCPLLLDEVTVHADATRANDLLQLLLRTAARHQVVLFTQEAHVAAWAEQHLTEPNHRTIRLTN